MGPAGPTAQPELLLPLSFFSLVLNSRPTCARSSPSLSFSLCQPGPARQLRPRSPLLLPLLCFSIHRPAALPLTVGHSAAPPGSLPRARKVPLAGTEHSPPSRNPPALGLGRTATARGMRGTRCRATRTPRPPPPFLAEAALSSFPPQPPLPLQFFPVPLRRSDLSCRHRPSPAPPRFRLSIPDPRPQIIVVAPWGGKDRTVPLLPLLFPPRERVPLAAVIPSRPCRGEL
jgi:hypothetical protein